MTLWPGQCLGSVGPPLPLRSAQKGQSSCHFSSFKGNRLEEQYRMSARGCRISDYRQEAGLGVRCQGNQPLVKKETVRWVKSKKVQDISREPRKSERELVLTRKHAGSNTRFYLLHQGNRSTAWKVGNANGLYLLCS